ncbi:hypothetical protein IFM89_017093 [Coptis chinensis]|uniref:Uncharacterized protein n=1 Tax=Coptis chinensis TaxID=261450 RepID=A0A835LMX2_9MAGN|nr:hypothetical protein IFM89_017093 [Coptis chinensis]
MDLLEGTWNWLSVPALGRSGGIIANWNSEFMTVVDNLVGAYALSVICSLKDVEFKWLLCCCLWAKSGFERTILGELGDNRACSCLPWCMSVDFNIT